jgi:ubiquinone/menaquinone biosynthesis C-methylase UbiE
MTRKIESLEGQVCPWWLIGTFDNPLRRLIHDPQRILEGLVLAGQQAADIGCGMGYFTIPLARLVGSEGKVYAIDVQDGMLAGVKRRASRAGLLERISLQRVSAGWMGLPEQVDFALAFWMVHETPDITAFLRQVHVLLKPGGKLLMVEPIMHVGKAAFECTLESARAGGFKPVGQLSVRFSRAMLLEA